MSRDSDSAFNIFALVVGAILLIALVIVVFILQIDRFARGLDAATSMRHRVPARLSRVGAAAPSNRHHFQILQCR
jgi:hypothetical protein